MDVYKTVRSNTRHKEKIFVFELFFSCNIISIYNVLKSEEYKHGKQFGKYRAKITERKEERARKGGREKVKMSEKTER